MIKYKIKLKWKELMVTELQLQEPQHMDFLPSPNLSREQAAPIEIPIENTCKISLLFSINLLP